LFQLIYPEAVNQIHTYRMGLSFVLRVTHAVIALYMIRQNLNADYA